MTPDPAAASITEAERAARLAQAFADHRAGRLADAAEIYRELTAADPSYLPAVHGLGLVTHDLGSPEQALPLLARCMAEEPENVAYRCSLGMVSLALGRAEAAVVALLPAANARADEPGRPAPARARAGRPWALGGSPRDSWSRPRPYSPSPPDLWSWRGRAARELGQLDEAETAWRQALALAPGDPEILNDLGVLLRRRGRLKEAAEAYRAALATAPDHAVFHNNLGNVLGQLGDERAAEIPSAAARSRSIRTSPTASTIWVRIWCASISPTRPCRSRRRILAAIPAAGMR